MVALTDDGYFWRLTVKPHWDYPTTSLLRDNRFGLPNHCFCYEIKLPLLLSSWLYPSRLDQTPDRIQRSNELGLHQKNQADDKPHWFRWLSSDHHTLYDGRCIVQSDCRIRCRALWEKKISMLFAGREVRIGKNCARAVLKNKGTAQMLEKKIYLFQSTKFFKLLKQLFPVRLGK